MKKLFVSLFLFSIFIIPACSEDSGSPTFDCNKFCDKSLECQEIKESQLENCKTYCKKYDENQYFEDAYKVEMAKCLTKDKCEDIKSCAQQIQSSCPPPPDISKYVETLCNKMIECNATTDTKEACIQRQNKPDSYKCLTQRFIDDITTCISKVNCATYLTDFLNCQSELLK